MRVLLSAFACDPTKGSEPSNGWNWATGLAAKGYEVHCLTRDIGRVNINAQPTTANLNFHFIRLPFKLEKLYSLSQPTMYLYYLLWQWFAYKKAKKLQLIHSFDIAHHVTWGSLQMGSFLYKLKLPFIFGPSGGGQSAPVAFKKYFLNSWPAEIKRERVTKFMLLYNPAFSKMLRQAKTVIVSNPDTVALAKQAGATNVSLSLDAALPGSFFPANFSAKKTVDGSLKLLWVGRFMPRKGLLLLVDVMKQLKDHPSITLTVVGDGEIKNTFLDQIQKYSLKNTVHWAGAVPFNMVKEYYATHDVFVFTSLRDSCPAQLIEAMAYGLPVITLDLHGQSIIVNESTGIKCSCIDPELTIRELKVAILDLYHNPNKITTMSEAAHGFARRQTWKSKIDFISNQYYS